MPLSIQDPHDPDALLDYAIDWTAWIPAGDAIIVSTWKDLSPGLILERDEFTDTTATAWVTGGVPGDYALATNHIETRDGRQDDRTIRIKIKEL